MMRDTSQWLLNVMCNIPADPPSPPQLTNKNSEFGEKTLDCSLIFTIKSVVLCGDDQEHTIPNNITTNNNNNNFGGWSLSRARKRLQCV